MPADTFENDPRIRAMLLSVAQSDAARKDPAKSERTLQALAKIYQLSSGPDALVDPDAVLRKITPIIEKGVQVDSDTFRSVADFMAGGTADWRRDEQHFSHLIGLGVSALGPAVGIVNPLAGAAISIVGTWTEDTLNALAQPGLDLRYLSSTEPDRVGILSGMAYAKVYQLMGQDPNFQTVVLNSAIKHDLGIDLGTNPVQALPKDVADMFASILGESLSDLHSDQSRTQRALEELSKSVTGRLDTLTSSYTTLKEAVGRSEKSAIARGAVEQARQDFRRLNGEIGGAVNIATGIVSLLFDQQTGAVFGTAVQSAQQIFAATAQFTLEEIGGFALAGSYMTAVTSIIGILSKQTSPFTVIQQHLDRIESKIDGLRREINFRFDRIEEQQIRIIDKIGDVLREIRDGRREAVTHLQELQSKMDDLRDLIQANERATAEVEFNSQVSSVKAFFSEIPGPDFSQEAARVRYMDMLVGFYEHARSRSRHPMYACSSDRFEDVPLSIITGEMNGRRRVELMFGLLPVLCRTLGIPLVISRPGNDSTPSEFSQIGNPREWVKGVQAYLETRQMAPQFNFAASTTQIGRLWDEGEIIRSAAITAGSSEALLAAAARYQEAGDHLVRAIDSILQTWGDKYLRQFNAELHTAYERPAAGTVYDEPRAGNGWATWLTLNSDPVEVAEQLGLITRVIGGTEDNGIGYRAQWLNFVVNAGPLKGTTIGHGDTGWVEGHIAQTGFCWHFWAGQEQKVGGLTLKPGTSDAFLVFCIKLIREQNEFRLVSGNGPEDLLGYLGVALNNSVPELLDFEFAGSSAKVLGTIRQWCQTRIADVPEMSHVKNFPLLASRTDILGALRNYLQPKSNTTQEQLLQMTQIEQMSILTGAGRRMPWRENIADFLRLQILKNVNHLREVARPATEGDVLRGPWIVDECLRRLAGFGLSLNATPTLPSLPPEYALSERLGDLLRRIMDAATDAFKPIRAEAPVNNGDFQSTLKLPAATSTRIVIDPDGKERPLFECLYRVTNQLSAKLWFERLVHSAKMFVFDNRWTITENGGVGGVQTLSASDRTRTVQIAVNRIVGEFSVTMLVQGRIRN